MDWKSQCCTKISCLIALFLFFDSGYGAESDKVISQFDQEIRQTSGVLDSIKTELEKGRSRLKELQNEEGNYLTRLEQIEKNIEGSKTYLDLLSSQIDSVQEVIKVLGDSLEIAQQKLNNRQKIMKTRLRQAYMSGISHPLVIILTSKSPLDLLNRVRYLEELNRYDRNLIKDIGNFKTEIGEKKTFHQNELENLSLLRDEKAQEQKTFIDEQKTRKTMLEDIRNQKENYAAMIAELEASQRELNAMIELLEKKRKKAREDIERKREIAFEKRQGKLPWPVDGSIVTKFGKVVHPVYKTVIMSNGIDIEAKKGQGVKSVAPGNVIHTGWMRGLGQLVIVDHAGGYISVYSHLQDILVSQDEQVEYGQVLGHVGETGSLGGAKLHFEIRKMAEALDPLKWLESR